jgi:hypothetical protein
VRFGRELNATDDGAQFIARQGEVPWRGEQGVLPVLTGGTLRPFGIDVDRTHGSFPWQLRRVD